MVAFGGGVRAVGSVVGVGLAALAGGASDGVAARAPGVDKQAHGLLRLGAGLPVTMSPSAGASGGFTIARSRRTARICRSWRAMTDRLGETFIAARLRNTVLLNSCPVEAGDAQPSAWAWPWDERGLAGALPPRRAGEHGAWSILCGSAGPRERCAMVQTGVLTRQGDGIHAPRARLGFATHFVIATVGAEERVIWRLFIHDADGARQHKVDWNEAPGTVEVTSGSFSATVPFSVCSRAGCMLEIDVKASTDLVNRLWDGSAVRLKVVPPGRSIPIAQAFEGEVTASGLRRALPQLNGLRQRELRPVVERARAPETGIGAGLDPGVAPASASPSAPGFSDQTPKDP